MKFYAFLAMLLLLKTVSANDSHLADSHGPISIMGEHIHKKNEVMFSYRFRSMKMNKNLNGSKSLNLNEIMNFPNAASDNSGNYMNAPVAMRMNMHMFGVMYAPSNSYTLMLMSGILEKEMIQQRMTMSGGSRFSVNSNGISDTRLSTLFRIFENNNHKTHIGVGLSFPTGSIDNRDVTPSSSNTRLGYGMQNGSGTYQLLTFLNNVNNFKKVKFGQQIHIKQNISGNNSKGYKYGNFLKSSLWSSYRIFNNLSSSIKLSYVRQEKMNGRDNEMNPRMSPVFDSNNIGYQKINIGIGLNFINDFLYFKNHRFAVEILLPLFQKYRGIQMADSYETIIGWQYSF
tara:strand:- start:2339 stop:3367 length:1029 start_codon:yes stop_codon:yes gene_type:complete